MKTRFTAKVFCALFVAVVFSPNSFAQTAEQKRPRIGLVLSGGGGRGLAHIGVLEWFERNRIPVDCIAGTSIGGLVGALYSIGMTTDEMRAFLKSVDWGQAFGSGPTYEELSWRRKEDRRAFQVDIEVGLRNGVSLPNGLSSAHYIGLVMDRLALPYSSVTDFDQLPIPFRCAATDFLKAQSVTLKDGSLASAMRATMSIPGVFPPVERDGRVLVDGGLLNNIPTDIIGEMKPDIIIAVDVGTPLGDASTIATLTGIVQQSITVMTIENDRRNLRRAHIIIAPEMGNRSILDFSDIDKIADLGFEAAQQRAALLERLSLSQSDWQEHIALRRSKQKRETPAPDEVQIAGVEREAKKRIHEKLHHHAGSPLDVGSLERDLTRITGQGRYSSLGYTFSRDDDGSQKNILLVTARKKNHVPPVINVSAEIEGSDVNDLAFTMGARLTIYDIGRYGAEWRNDVKAGFRTLFLSEYYRPLGEDGFFIAPRASYRRERQFFFANRSRVAEFQTDRAGAGIDLGFANTRSEFRAGVETGYFDSHPLTGDGQSLAGRVDLARLRWAWDDQDSPTVATRGLRFATEWRWFFKSPGSSDGFQQAELSASYFHPVSDRGSLFLSAAGGTSFNHRAASFEQFTLGGPFRLGAYDRDEFRGSHYAIATLGYHRRIYELPSLLGGKIFAAGWYDIGGAFTRLDAGQIHNQFSGGLIMDTRLGPFSLICSFGEGGRGKVYFSFGKFF
ncbi:MAG: patatin-like phospholipase family protein [Acidobacteriota bacterium]